MVGVGVGMGSDTHGYTHTGPYYRLFLYGVKNLHVEVDAKYIKGMLNDPDLQPNATINCWIEGILLFDFKLIHVPAAHH